MWVTACVFLIFFVLVSFWRSTHTHARTHAHAHTQVFNACRRWPAKERRCVLRCWVRPTCMHACFLNVRRARGNGRERLGQKRGQRSHLQLISKTETKGIQKSSHAARLHSTSQRRHKTETCKDYKQAHTPSTNAPLHKHVHAYTHTHMESGIRPQQCRMYNRHYRSTCQIRRHTHTHTHTHRERTDVSLSEVFRL